MVTLYLLSLLNGHKAGELGHNGVFFADIDDERFSISLHNLVGMVSSEVENQVKGHCSKKRIYTYLMFHFVGVK